MAEAFLRVHGGERFEAHSAGLSPGEINPYVRRVMEEKGVDLKGQRSKNLDEYLGKVHFSRVITVCARAERQCPSVFPNMGERLFWPFDDPAEAEGSEEEKLEVFRRVRDEIEDRIMHWLAETGS